MKNHHFYFITCIDVFGLLEKSSLPFDENHHFYFITSITCMDVFGLQEKSSLLSYQKSSFLFYNLYGYIGQTLILEYIN